MKMNEQLFKLITFLNALQATGKHTAFYSYSGHVDRLDIAIYKGKWKEKKRKKRSFPKTIKYKMLL